MRPFTHFAFASLLAAEALALPKVITGIIDVKDTDEPWSNGYINTFHHSSAGGEQQGKAATTSSAAAVASSSAVSAASAASTTSIASTASGHQSGGSSYIVLFKNGASTNSGTGVSAQDTKSTVSTASTDDVLSQMGLSSDHPDVHYTFNNTGFRGFAASLQSHCLDQLQNNSDIAFVEPVMTVTTHATTARSGGPWGLQRISSSSSVSGNSASLDFTYSYANTELGSGVDVYVVDTGVNTDHVAFNGRARMGWWYDANAAADGDGHGTHVSGTAAGTTFGVASMANIIGVKVLNDQGTGQTLDTVNGINWVVSQHNQRKSQPGFVGSVLSMSWGLSATSAAIDAAIRAATNSGIHAAVASGNQASDSCSVSPASSGGSQGPAISVGSVGIGNAVSSFSNNGACTDLYAPGENVISAWIGGDNVINTLDGTSMATPHVTGVIAYTMLAQPQLAQDPVGMKTYLTGNALKGQVTGNTNSGDAMLLLNNGITGLASKVRRGGEIVVKRGVPSLGGLDGAVSRLARWFSRRQTFYMAEGVSRLRY